MIKLKNIKPFQCFLINQTESVLINFGVVVCPNLKSVNNIFVPTIESRPLKRFREEGFSQNNSLSISTSNSAICLKIVLEDISDLVANSTIDWESVALYEDNDLFIDLFNKTMNLDRQQELFNLSQGDDVSSIDFESEENLSFAKDCYFNQTVSWSPSIQSVSIIEYPIGDWQEIENSEDFNFIKQDEDTYYRLIPISLIRGGSLIQLIDNDYIFSFPFFWLNSLKENFKNVSSETI